MANFLTRKKFTAEFRRDQILVPLCFFRTLIICLVALETTSAKLFADDTFLSATGLTVDEIETKLNHDLIKVNQWLIANKLTLNESITEFII